MLYNLRTEAKEPDMNEDWIEDVKEKMNGRRSSAARKFFLRVTILITVPFAIGWWLA